MMGAVRFAATGTGLDGQASLPWSMGLEIYDPYVVMRLFAMQCLLVELGSLDFPLMLSPVESLVPGST